MSSREKKEKEKEKGGSSTPLSPRRHTEGDTETNHTISGGGSTHNRSTSGGKQNSSIVPVSPRPNSSGDLSSGGSSSGSSSGSKREKNLPALSPRPNSNGSEISAGGGSKREKALAPVSPIPPGSEISMPNTPKGSAISQPPQSDWVHKTKSGRYVDMAALAKDFSDPLSGIRLFQTYFDIFTGAEVVDFIIAICKCTRKEAVPIGQELLEKAAIFEHVRQNRTFEDKPDVFYRLIKPKPSIDTTQLIPYGEAGPGPTPQNQPQQPQQPQQPINQTFTFLIHGWNDDIKQWKEIRNLLNEELGHPVHLFVYRSLDDNSTIENLAVRFHTFVNERIMESTTLNRPMTEEEKKKEMEKRKKKSKGSSRELVEISAPSNFRKRQIDRTVDNTEWLGLMQKYQLLDLDKIEFWEMLRTHFPSVYQNLPIIQLEKFIIENKVWFDEQRSKLKANVELWKEKKDQFVAETKEKTEELKEKTDQYIKEKKEKLVETKERMRDRKDLFVLETMEKTEQYIKEKREKLNETKDRIRERKEKLMANLQSSDDKRDQEADVEDDAELRHSYWRKKKLKRKIRNVERKMERISEGGEGWEIMEQSETELKMNESTMGRWKWRAGSIIRASSKAATSSNSGDADELVEPKEEDEGENVASSGSLIQTPNRKNKEKDEEKSIEDQAQQERVENELFEPPDKQPQHPLSHTMTKKEVKRQRKLTRKEEYKREKERKEKEKADKKHEKQERKQKRKEEKAKGKQDKKGSKLDTEESKDSSEPSSMENSTDSQEPQQPQPQPQQPQQPQQLSGSWRLGRVARSSTNGAENPPSEEKKDLGKSDEFPVICRQPLLIETLDEEEEEKVRQAAALENEKEEKGKEKNILTARKESITTETEPAEDETEENWTDHHEDDEEEVEEEGDEEDDEEDATHTASEEDASPQKSSAKNRKLTKAEKKQLAKKQKEDKERAKREQKEQLKEKKKQESLEKQRERKERLEQLRENRAKREKERAEREKEKKGTKQKKKEKGGEEEEEGDEGDEEGEDEGTEEAVREHTEETERELETEDEREKSIPQILVEPEQPQPQQPQHFETSHLHDNQAVNLSLRRKKSLSAEPLRAVMLSQLIADAVQQQQKEGGGKREKEKPKQSRSEITPLQKAEWKRAEGHKRSRSVDAANNKDKISKEQQEKEKEKEKESKEEEDRKGITLGSRVQADLTFGKTTYHASAIWAASCPNGPGCKETDPEHFKKFQHGSTQLELQISNKNKGEQQIQNFNKALALRDEGKMTLAVVNTATTVRMEMKAMKAREKAMEKERKEKEKEMQRMRKEEKKKMKRERKEKEKELARQRKEMKKGVSSVINMTGLEKDGVKINIVVYSTGALILRHFLRLYYWSHYQHKIDHVVMFAPANYGSPYAKKGKTGVGKYWVGQKTNFKHMFECGKELLTSLECSSPFLWDLAHHDIFAEKSKQYFKPSEIKTFIMQGTETYDLAKLGTKLTRGNTMFGTDGTVTVSGASLRVKKLHLDLSSSSIANNTANKIIHHKKPPACTTQVVFRMQDQLNHRSIVDSLGGKTQAFDWLKQALAVEDEKEFMYNLEAELMHNSALYNQGFIPGKLIIFRYKGDEDVMDEMDMTLEMERQPKLRFEVLAVDESRLKGTMRKISFGMHVDHFCMTVIRDKAKVAPLLQAFGKFIYHSRSRKTFYFMLNPEKIHNEMLKLSQNHFNGKPIAVAGCLKGNPGCARLLVCSNLSTPLTDHRRYDHAHLIEITPPEKGVRDFAQEIDTKLIVLERQEKLQQKDGQQQQQEETPVEPALPQLEVLQKILKLLKKDDDVDDTLHDIIERGLNRLVRPFGAQGRLADLLRMICVEKLPELCVSCRKRLIKFLMGTPWVVSDEYFSALAREAVVYILVNTSGEMLTQLKNGLDESDGTEAFCENSDRNNLHRIVFYYLKNVQIQQSKLEFFKPYDVTASLLDDEKGEGCLPLQQLVMSHIRKEGDSWKEKRRKDTADNTKLPTPKSANPNDRDDLDLEGLDEEKKEKKRRKRTERQRRREEMKAEVQKIEKEERKGKRFKVVSGIFDLLVHGMESVFPDEALFPGAQALLERVVASQKGGLVFLTGVRPATMTENTMLRRTHELLSRLNLPPRTVIELDVSDSELNATSPTPLPLKASYPSWSVSMPNSESQQIPKLSEETRQKIMKLTLLRLKEYISLYPEYKFILLADSEYGDAQLMLTSLYEAMQGPKEKEDEEEKEKEEKEKEEKDKEKEKGKKKGTIRMKRIEPGKGTVVFPIERTSNAVRLVLVREVGGKPFSPLYKKMKKALKIQEVRYQKGKERENTKQKETAKKRIQIQPFKTFVGASLRAYEANLLKFDKKDTLLAVCRTAVEEMQKISFARQPQGDSQALRLWDALQHDLEAVREELKRTATLKPMPNLRASVHRDLRASISAISLMAYQIENEDEERLKELSNMISQTVKEQAPLLLSEEGIHLLKVLQKKRQQQQQKQQAQENEGETTTEEGKEKEKEGESEEEEEKKKEDQEVEEFKKKFQSANTMEELMGLLMRHSPTQLMSFKK